MAPEPKKSPPKHAILMIWTAITLAYIIALVLSEFLGGSPEYLPGLFFLLIIILMIWGVLIVRTVRNTPWFLRASANPGVNWLVASAWLILILIAAALVYVLILSSPPYSIVAIFPIGFLALLVMFSASGVRRNRRRITSAILAYLQQLIRLNLPLGTMLREAGQAEPGLLGFRLVNLGDHLDWGKDLETALDTCVPEIPANIVHAVGAAERMGRLPDVLERLNRRSTPAETPTSETNAIYRSYPLIFMLMFPAVVLVIVICVFPKFQAIFNDYHLPLPPISLFFYEWWDSTAGQYVLVLIGVIGVGFILASFRTIFLGRLAQRPWGHVLASRLIWKLPIWGGLARDQALTDFCGLLADAVDASMPLDEALRESASSQPSAVLQDRAMEWARAVNMGQATTAAARSAKMPRLLVDMIAATRDSDDLVQVLRFLSRQYESRALRTQALLQTAYVPIVVAIMGTAVALLALSIFQPMVMLQEASAHFAGGF